MRSSLALLCILIASGAVYAAGEDDWEEITAPSLSVEPFEGASPGPSIPLTTRVLPAKAAAATGRAEATATA